MKRTILALALALAVFAFKKRGDDEPAAATRLTFAGVTDQDYRITAFVENGRVVEFRTRLLVDCAGPGDWTGSTHLPWRGARGGDDRPITRGTETVWKRTWEPALEHGMIVDRGPLPAKTGQSAATSVLTARLTGETLRGTLATSIDIEYAGSTLKCVADDVRFSLRA